MRPENEWNEAELERVVGEIRNEAIDPATADAAAERVWARLKPLRGCADIQALIPDYRSGRLPESRALLVRDHIEECVACRHAVEAASGKVRAMPSRAARARVVPYWRWAVAAVLVAGVGFSTWAIVGHMGASASRMTIASLDGTLYRVGAGAIRTVAVGEVVPAGEEVRTAKDSHAVVRLRDGSLVEMRERSAMRVSENWRDMTVRLARGAIIVQAAKRRTGHLYVDTRDCRVSVTGTIFSVNSGVKGSRVSVVEGEVRVARNSAEHILHSGDQVATDPSMAATSVQDEVAWSRNVDRYIALVKEFSTLKQRLEQVHMPALRYSGRFLNALPPDTVVYVAIPNLGSALGEAQQVIQQRVAESPVLQQWWSQASQGRAGMDEIVGKLRAFSEYLGDEIVIAAQKGDGHISPPVLMAELKRPGFRQFAEAQLQAVSEAKAHLRFVESAAALATSPKDELVIYNTANLIAVSPSVSALQNTAAALEGRGGGFTGTAFGARIADSYRNGAGFLFAADLEQLHGSDGPQIQGLKYVVLEQKDRAGRSDTHAVLGFDGLRTGVFSWLGAPAPMGSLDYVSPDATLAAAFAIKSPAKVLDEVLSSHDADISQFESHVGVSVRNDIAATLGGEFTFAVDGPMLPVPSWKLVVECYDPARFEQSVRKLAEAWNTEAVKNGKPAVAYSSENAGGRQYYTLAIPDFAKFGEIHFTFNDGYLVAAASRPLVDRALQYRANGYSLPRSAQFMQLLPRDRYTNFSAAVYNNFGSVLAPLAGLLGSAAGNLSPDQQQKIQSMTQNMKPMLFTAYGDSDRITIASNGSIFGLGLQNMMGLSPMALGGMLGGTMGGTMRPSPAYRNR